MQTNFFIYKILFTRFKKYFDIYKSHFKLKFTKIFKINLARNFYTYNTSVKFWWSGQNIYKHKTPIYLLMANEKFSISAIAQIYVHRARMSQRSLTSNCCRTQLQSLLQEHLDVDLLWVDNGISVVCKMLRTTTEDASTCRFRFVLFLSSNQLLTMVPFLFLMIGKPITHHSPPWSNSSLLKLPSNLSRHWPLTNAKPLVSFCLISCC